MKARRFVRYWMPVIVWMALIFLGSTDMLSAEHTSRFLVPFLRWLDPQISIATILSIHFALRKLGHLIEYGILAVLLWRALRGRLTSTGNLVIASLVFMVSAIFAASDELHQSFVPSRTASMRDVAIDIGGAMIGLAICWAFALRRKPQTIY